jgi:hypothetical protein
VLTELELVPENRGGNEVGAEDDNGLEGALGGVDGPETDMLLEVLEFNAE